MSTDIISSIVDIIIHIVGVAAVVATMTPNENDNKAVDFILNLVNMLGGNLGRASNDPKA